MVSFHRRKIPTFLENFESIKEKIRRQGIVFRIIPRQNNKSIFFLQLLETEDDLENYRKSELFTTVWSFTKKNYLTISRKPGAWTN
jgi:hypothetical protein